MIDARRLWRAGLTPIPLCRPTEQPGRCTANWHDIPCPRIGKTPLVAGYPKLALRRPSFEELAAHFRRQPTSNIGIVTGAGIIAIEADSPEAEREVVALAGRGALDQTPTRERRRGRGRAWLFATDKEVRNGAGRGESRAIDVRGNGGILVMPPSVHESGHVYAWVRGLSPWDVAPARLPATLQPLITSPTTDRREAVAVVMAVHPRPLPPKVASMVRSRRRIADLWNGVGKQIGDSSASGYDFAFVRELLFNDVALVDAAAALALRPGAHRRDDAYVSLTVGRAQSALVGRKRK